MPTPKETELRRREEALAVEIAALLGDDVEEVLERIRAGEVNFGDDFWQARRNTWQPKLARAVIGVGIASFLMDISRLFGGESEPPDGYQQQARLGALAYGETYVPNTLNDIMGTSKDIVSATVAEYLLDDAVGIDALQERLIAAGFAEGRARQIAITEITRANYRAEENAAGFLQNNGFEIVRRWFTAADDRVCPICAPLHGLLETPQGGWDASGVGPGVVPDAHIGCRCYTVTELA